MNLHCDREKVFSECLRGCEAAAGLTLSQQWEPGNQDFEAYHLVSFGLCENRGGGGGGMWYFFSLLSSDKLLDMLLLPHFPPWSSAVVCMIPLIGTMNRVMHECMISDKYTAS